MCSSHSYYTNVETEAKRVLRHMLHVRRLMDLEFIPRHYYSLVHVLFFKIMGAGVLALCMPVHPGCVHRN